MIRRLLAVAGVAASLSAATFMSTPVADAAPGDPNQVALVVQTSPGSVQVRCVDHDSGMTGADVLAAAAPAYGTGPYAGFVLQIDGFGNTRTKPPSDSTYWAYWRGTGSGTYAYSGAGVTSTQPAAGSVEAWIWYDNGAVAFPHRTYASLCPGGYASTPAPAIPAPTATAVVAAPPTPAGGTARATGSSRATPGPGVSSTAPGTVAPTTAPTAAVDPTTPSTGTAAATGSTVARGSVAASNVAATEERGGLGAGPTIGLLAVAAAVVGFAVLAVLARRRRLDQD